MYIYICILLINNGFKYKKYLLLVSYLVYHKILSSLLFLLFLNDLKRVYRFCKHSLFAGDLKMCMTFNSLYDCEKLQDDITRFSKWWKDNYLLININKCVHISFTRRETLVMYNFSIDNQNHNSVTSIKYLGIILSADFTLYVQISFI